MGGEPTVMAHRAGDPLARLLDGLSALGSVWIGLLMLLVCTDVVSRSLFNHPLPAIAEMAAYAVVGIVFLQLPAAFYRSRMTRSDLVSQWLERRAPRLGRLLEAMFASFTIAIFAILAKVSLHAAQVSFVKHETAGVEGVFSFPAWPLRALITLGAALSALALLVLLFRLYRPAPPPGNPQNTHNPAS